MRDLEWNNAVIRKDDWVLLDLYGTNHHRPSWGDDADAFNPDRYQRSPQAEHHLVPQGAGSVANSHRCPGEDPTISLMAEAIRRLCTLSYELPRQDLSIDMARIPALPASGVKLRVTQ
jgi:fatty-acid peroxygenase